MSTRFAVPANPGDVEHAALNLIVQLPAELYTSTPAELLRPLVECLQDFCGLLHAEQALAGMAWQDAKGVAAAIAFDLCCRDDGAEFLRHRAGNALAGVDNMEWLDPDQVAHAFTVAAALLDRL